MSVDSSDLFGPIPFPEAGSPTTRRPKEDPGEIAALKFEIERLLLVSEALWTILKERHGLEEEELIQKMVTIDLRDGKLDGKLAKSPPIPCPKCRRIVAKRHARCLYCGELIPPDPFAR